MKIPKIKVSRGDISRTIPVASLRKTRGFLVSSFSKRYHVTILQSTVAKEGMTLLIRCISIDNIDNPKKLAKDAKEFR